MPGRLFEIRYPNGDFEFDAGPRPAPSVGEVIERKGKSWRVVTKSEGRPIVLRVEATADDRKQTE
jgi:hypothetical protein